VDCQAHAYFTASLCNAGLDQRTYSTSGRVSTGMSDVCGFDRHSHHLGI